MNAKRLIYCLLLVAVSLTATAKEFKKSYYFQRAEEAYKNNNFDEVLRVSKLGVEENPKDGYCWALIAEICAKRAYARYDEALEACDQAFKYINKADNQWRAFIVTTRGDIYYKIGDLQGSKEAYGLARTMDPTNSTISISYADVCYELGDYDEGVKTYEKIFDDDPSLIYVLPELAKGYRKLGRVDDAKKACKLANVISSDRNYNAHYRLAEMAVDEGQLSLACREAAHALTLDKNFEGNTQVVDTLIQLCQPLFRAAMLNELDKTPTDPDAHMRISTYYLNVLDFLHAIYHLHRAEQLGKDHKQMLQAYLPMYQQFDEKEKSLEILDELMLDDSVRTEHNAYYCDIYSMIYRDMDEPAKAIEYSLRELRSSDREDDDAYRMIGRSYIMAGELENALVYMDSAVMTANEFMMPTALFNRGEVYRMLGNEDAAVRDFRDALSYRNNENSDRSTFVYVEALLGDTAAVRQFADSVNNLSSPVDRARDCFHVFSAYSLLRDKPNTLLYLDKYFAGGFRIISDVRTHYRMKWLNEDADYQALLAKWEAVRQDEVRTLHELLSDEETADAVTELPFTMDGGVCKVKCVINGLPLYFVFDTGASDVSISSVEANFMLKNGYLTDADFLGKQNYVTATGEIHEGTVINLREVRIGDIVLKDVKASVVKSQAAPLLLGQTVFRRFGTLEVDNKASVIRFRKN